jgi:drug/metabolite transporter (DMT)-like permease
MTGKKRNQSPLLADATLMGPVYMLAAALLFTVLNLCIKLMGPQYSPWHIGFFRFAGGVLILVTLFSRGGNPFRSKNVRLLVIRGCTGTVAFLGLVTALRQLPISSALVIFYSFPSFAALFGFVLYGEQVGKWQMGCIALALAGIGVMLGVPVSGTLLGQLAAVVGAIFAGLTVTLIRSLRATNGPAVIYLYFCSMGTLVTLPVFVANPVIPADSREWLLVAGIVSTSVAAQLLMNQGFFYCRGWEGGVLMSSEVLFTALAGIVLMGDPTGLGFYLGAGLIVASVVALSLKRRSPALVVLPAQERSENPAP